MNCQIFSWPLSSSARGGSCKSEMLFGIEEENSVSARSDFGCDLIEVKLHSFGVAGRQHEGGAGSAFGADRTEQVGRLGPLIVGGTGACTLPAPATRELFLLAVLQLNLQPD